MSKKFIPFITCGLPDLETTKQTLLQMAQNGADIIELGIPFSDPIAEGEVIEKANELALKEARVDDIFKMLDGLEISAELAFMTYANVVFSYGSEQFLQKASSVGIKYLILPDVPFEEKGEFQGICEKYGISLISMIAPSSKSRIAKIAKSAKGFIYLVSSLGVTGVRSEINTPLEEIIQEIRKHTQIPIFVGFGISNATQAKKIANLSDGVIIGSAIVKIALENLNNKNRIPALIGAFTKEIKEAIN